MRKAVVLLCPMLLCTSQRAWGETIEITAILSGEANGNLKVRVEGKIAGTPLTTYQFRLEAQEAGQPVKILVNAQRITTLADGKAYPFYENTASSLKKGVKYKFVLKLYKGTDDPDKATPIDVDSEYHTISQGPYPQEPPPPPPPTACLDKPFSVTTRSLPEETAAAHQFIDESLHVLLLTRYSAASKFTG